MFLNLLKFKWGLGNVNLVIPLHPNLNLQSTSAIPNSQSTTKNSEGWKYPTFLGNAMEQKKLYREHKMGLNKQIKYDSKCVTSIYFCKSYILLHEKVF